MKKKQICLMMLWMIVASVSAKDFYASPDGKDSNPGTKSKPFATLEKARDAVRQMQPHKEAVNVYIRGGVYFRDKTFVLTEKDSGTEKCPIVYQSFQNEEVIISGGRIIEGWQKGDDGVWKTHLPDVEKGKLFFRQLFIDGKRAIRARFPNVGDEMLKLEEIFDYNPLSLEQKYTVDQNFPSANLEGRDAELVQLHFWSMARQRIKSSQGRSIITSYPAGCVGHYLTSPFKGNPLFLEHAPEFLDQPGEWYLNRDTGWLYYQAAPGENPNDRRFVVPVVEKLIELKGQKNSPIQYVFFKGIAFAHAAWELPFMGYNGLQAGVHGTKYLEEPMFMLPLAIHLEYAQNCQFEMCRLKHTGASGLGLGAGCRENKILGCEFFDIGGNAIVVGWRRKADEPPRRLFDTDWIDKSDAPVGNIISHNHIHHSATVQFGGVGYFESFSRDTVFSHNLIHHMPYTGISVGLRWDEVPSTQLNSDIGYNELHHTMELLHDGGAIYTLGYQPGTTVHHNYIHDTDNHGLYADGGSSHITFENNVISRVRVHGFQQNYGSYNTVRNNIFASCGTYALHRNLPTANEPAFIIERNIIWIDRYEKSDFWWYAGETEDEGGVLFEKSESDSFKMDHNLFWDTRDGKVTISGLSLEEHQGKRGKDLHSIVADPQFADPSKDDFTLAKDSPAFQIGFKPIDISTVGPQGKYRIFLKLPKQ